MPQTSAENRWVLDQSRPLRLFTLFILYVTQGVPIGLFWFAIPAWMAAKGASATDVAYVLGFTALPWTLKLINGFLMDRYTFLPMGRRRVWLIGAQLVMIAALLVCAFIAPASSDVAMLAAAGFVVNMATTYQDVAVDGLAVDIMEEEERARASGMMFGGQAIGIALSTAGTGMVISLFGASAAYLLSALFIAVISLYVVLLRERPGERRLPWSNGTANPRNLAIQAEAWWPILKTTFISLIKPASLLWIPVLLTRGFHYGALTGMTPMIGTGHVGLDEAAITSITGTGGLIAGLLGLTLGGWLGDKFGAKISTIGMFAMFIMMSAIMYLGISLWSDAAFFSAFIFVWLAFDTLITVVALPISMRLCDPKVAATQFTLYMACSNFGTTLGASALGFAEQIGGLRNLFLVVMGFHIMGLIVMIFVKFPRRKGHPSAIEEAIADQLPQGDGMVPVHN
jgi:PAT family beta-lactamase induction signal transducer AmpG